MALPLLKLASIGDLDTVRSIILLAEYSKRKGKEIIEIGNLEVDLSEYS